MESKNTIKISDELITKELKEIRAALGKTSWQCKSSIMFMFKTKYGSGIDINRVEKIYNIIKDNDEETV